MTDEIPEAPAPDAPPAPSLAQIARAVGISISAIYKRKARQQVVDGPSRATGQRICPKCKQPGHYAKTCGKPRQRGQLVRG